MGSVCRDGVGRHHRWLAIDCQKCLGPFTAYHPHHCVEEIIEDPADALIRDTPQESSSCLAVFTSESYEFQIVNETGVTFGYSINGENFSLSPDYYRNHTYPKASGSDGCDTQYYDNPTIRFDYSGRVATRALLFSRQQ